MRYVTAFFALMIVLIIIIANRGFNERFLDVFRAYPQLDKVLHFLLFGTMAFLLNHALKRKRLKLAGRHLFTGGIVIAVLCTLEEFSQMGIDSRTFSLIDLAADMLGIAFAEVLTRRYLRSRSLEKEVITHKG